MTSSFLPGKLTEQARTLCAELRADPGARRHIVAWLLLQEDLVLATPGLLRYLGWTAMSGYLHLVTDAFDRWRDEDQWLRSYCPTCGSLPAMLQLIGVDQGRRRLLADWTSIHLDVVACDRGLKRLAASLYELNLNF